MERRVNQRHRYDYASAAGVERHSTPVLKDLGSVFDPFVLKHDDKLLMYYSDRSSGNVMVAWSIDGIDWCNKTVALKHADDYDAWDAVVNRACVLKRENEFYMWFTGQGKGGTSIGFAKSSDGLTFRKIADEPVISHESFDGCEAVMNPCVIWDEDLHVFRMWFSAGEEYEPDVIFAATSDNGIAWTLSYDGPVLRKGENVYDQAKVGGCHVLNLGDDDGYLMFYIGYQNVDVARICAAWSPDGLRWFRHKANPLISPRQGRWDSDATYKPTALIDKKTGEIKIWYNGRCGTVESIGFAKISAASEGLLNPNNYIAG